MTKRMLIDATHEEETRVAVMDGHRLEEFDYESKYRKPLKGSIFLAKVTRVEPSLQAAFVNFGGNRHGFLPFSEIHPDYFRIPVADREALLAEQEAMMGADAEEEEQQDAAHAAAAEQSEVADAESGDVMPLEDETLDAPIQTGNAEGVAEEIEGAVDEIDAGNGEPEEEILEDEDEISGNIAEPDMPLPEEGEELEGDDIGNTAEGAEPQNGDERDGGRRRGRGRYGRGRGRGRGRHMQHRAKRGAEVYDDEEAEGGGDRFRFSLRRKYKIQEVIKRGQIMLVQVSKEERGNKGAAVSSYLSLPGRYCVLMPNSPRAGGVSRKIANYKDRARMREMLKEMNLPQGMSVIVRTAGVERTKAEIKRDLDYLMRLWDNIRELTLQSSAPAMVYEEADLIKRAVRDLYGKDIEEIVVAGKEGYETAKNFMKMMMPSHVKRVNLHEDEVPLFTRYHAEALIAETGESQVTLPSGGYLVINPTEALVSIDVNSGRATKERHIEETALKTNMEAATEVARQLRLRDLGGLIVIDFIDMEDRRNNAKVERRMREALSTDRARIQMGRISSFGLMELSRQRLSPSLTESQYEVCKHCAGVGRIRTSDATSIMVLRAIEAEGIRKRASQLIVHVSNAVALYILNNKRKNVSEIEERYGLTVLIRVDEAQGASGYRIEVSRPSGRSGDEEAADQDNDSKDGGRGGRRRGRRGGRGGRQGKPVDNNYRQSLADDLNQDLDEDSEEQDFPEESQSTEGSDEDRFDGEEIDDRQHGDGPRGNGRGGRGRGRGRGRGGRGRGGGGRSPGDQSDRDRPQQHRAAAASGQSRTQYVSAQAEESQASPSAEEPPAPVADIPSKRERAASVSNDEGPAHAKAFEKVNEPPSEKKRGWWNRGGE